MYKIMCKIKNIEYLEEYDGTIYKTYDEAAEKCKEAEKYDEIEWALPREINV